MVTIIWAEASKRQITPPAAPALETVINRYTAAHGAGARIPNALVEFVEESGMNGPFMEGDVMIVDKARVPGHGDLVLAEVESEQRLFH